MSEISANEARRLKAIMDNRRNGLCGCGREMLPDRDRCQVCLDAQRRRDHDRIASARTSGLCLCGEPVIPNRSRCATCAASHAASASDWSKRNVARGHCRVCGAPPPLETKIYCSSCAPQYLAYIRRWNYAQQIRQGKNVAKNIRRLLEMGLTMDEIAERASVPVQRLRGEPLSNDRPTATQAILDAANRWRSRAQLTRVAVDAGVTQKSASTLIYNLTRDGRLLRRGQRGSYEFRASKRRKAPAAG